MQLFWIVFGISGWVTVGIICHMFFCDVNEMNERWLDMVNEMNDGWYEMLKKADDTDRLKGGDDSAERIP